MNLKVRVSVRAYACVLARLNANIVKRKENTDLNSEESFLALEALQPWKELIAANVNVNSAFTLCFRFCFLS